MRKTLSLCAAVLLLLCVCSERRDCMQEALDFRQKLLASGGCAFTADVTADYGDYTYSFTLECRYRDGRGELAVLKPEEISGIRGSCTGDASNVSFDGAILEYGNLANGYLAPLSVPWLFGSGWEGDAITFASRDEDRCRITIQKGYQDEKLVMDTWLSDGIPAFGEVAGADGRRALAVSFRDFHFLNDDP